MADSLPLIPEKGPTHVCTDVKPVLRRVFQNLDILPPLAVEPKQNTTGGSGDDVDEGEWIEDFEKECTEICKRETELKNKFAERLSREPLPNIYRLHCHSKRKVIYDQWKENYGILERSQLLPSITQNADVDETLWVKNILDKSSGDLTRVVESSTSKHMMSVRLNVNKYSDESWSMGEVARPHAPLPPPPPPPPPQPDHIVCIPPQLEFVNFVVGCHYEQQLQLVNVSNVEVRLSVRPPRRRELLVELTGARGLVVTSGAAAFFNIHFTPRDSLTLQDAFLARVSTGKTLTVPIRCYMRPPILEIQVPAISPSVFFCTPDVSGADVHYATDTLELGARLLGDVHHARLMFHCDADHASFFLLTEDAWVTSSLEELTSAGATLCGNFTVWPSWWRGGGAVRGGASCRADVTGLHVAALRVLSSTASVRHLYLLADSLYFHREHVTIEAHEKDYDICSDDDPACEYYVHLGTAFPNRPLSATVSLVNHSPITYSFYWSVRPWGVCSCSWEDEQVEVEEGDMCVGGVERKRKEQLLRQLGEEESERASEREATRVGVQPARGVLGPRCSVPVHLRAPDVGARLGVRRAVLMLVLKDIPVESFPPGYEPEIVKTTSVSSQNIPGVESWKHDVCEVVCAQMEVWWEVAPVRFVIDPPLLPIMYSRRVKSVDISVRATLLFGSDSVDATFEAPPHVDLPKTITMSATHSYLTDVRYSLPLLPNEFWEFDTITLTAGGGEWRTAWRTWRTCPLRHPALRPPCALLGVVPPGRDMHTTLQVVNDTHQHICWWCTPYRWLRERQPAPACEGRLPCDACCDRACSCDLLRPTRGALKHAHTQDIRYHVNAPDSDGIVATLVQVRRTGADVARVAGGAGTEARCSLLAYRVLAPRLVLRALPCRLDEHGECEGCALDAGARGAGAALLRPARALALHLRTCYRLLLTNLTPLPTHVSWTPPLEQDALKVKFLPNDFKIEGYGQVKITVVLEALKVTGRRLFVCRGRVEHTYKPLYLLIDAAIAGLEIICEVPIGAEEHTSSKLIMKRTQREVFPWEENKPNLNTPEEMFAENERLQADTRCRCSIEMLYVPPAPEPAPPDEGDDLRPPQIICEPPELTAFCKCCSRAVPVLPEYEETLCLQFTRVPLHTVRSRVITIRNESVLTARLKVAFRHWQRKRNRTVDKDKWSADVRPPGVAVQCTPDEALVPPRSALALQVDVYSDCWGLYREQMLIKVEHLSPIVLDVWIETVGSPLMFALTMPHVEDTPAVWVSSTVPDRVVRVKNVSRSTLALQAYIATEHEFLQDELPFRLYIRFYDVQAPTCPCMDYKESEDGECARTEASSSYVDETVTMIELRLLPDFGLQNNDFFQVSPTCATVEAGAWHQWHVSLQPPPGEELAPNCLMIVDAVPIDNAGIRKTFRVSNAGSLGVCVRAGCEPPWCVVDTEPVARCGAGCCCAAVLQDRQQAPVLELMPRSSLQVCVELKISTAAVWPEPPPTPGAPPTYAPRRRTEHRLTLYDDHQVYVSIPLVLELEYPIVRVEPALIDFGFVTDGDTRKSYFTVSHTSRSTALDLAAEWVGPKQFRIRPTSFRLQPGEAERVYIQYSAVWCGAMVEGCVVVRAACGGGAWCRAGGRAAALPARDAAAARLDHDHTDDAVLLPPYCEDRAYHPAAPTFNTHS